VTGRAGLVLGADGGNTKTIVAVADAAGKVLAAVRGPASDIYARAGTEAALDAIAGTAHAALAAAGARPADLAATAWSLAGADWPEDFALLERELAARIAAPCAPNVVNDAIGGLRSGSPDFTGIAIVCGTFNAVCARNADGRVFHLGFWPDRVGGFDLGHAALLAVYRDGLGLGPATALTPRALAAFEAKDVTALLHAFTRRAERVPIFFVQRLAPILLDVADAGDAVARAIVRDGAHRLAAQARVSAARVDIPVRGTRVVLTGGVLQHPSPLLADTIVADLPGAIPVRATAPPVIGALLLAYDSIGLAMEAEPLGKSLGAALA
jgi:N-acetylglucosamine kinase-like BadF-type ATPase